MRYAYIHGFASGPMSRKGTFMREQFEARGHAFEQPDLNRPSFAQLTFTGALEAIDAMADAHPGERWCFIGSSMGGYLSALWSARNPERVERLVLLCPAFNLVERWLGALGADDVAAWERVGARVFADGAGEPTELHWGFIEDSRQWPASPVSACPTRVIHGRLDETVPIENSRAYALEHDHVELIEIDDDHQMIASAGHVLEWSLEWFGLSEGS